MACEPPTPHPPPPPPPRPGAGGGVVGNGPTYNSQLQMTFAVEHAVVPKPEFQLDG